MKGKKMIVSAALLALPGMSHVLRAQSFDYLTFQTVSAERSVALADLKKITFSGSQMTAVTEKGDLTFELADMKKLYFTETPSAVEQVRKNAALKVGYDRAAECIRIEGNEAGTQVTVYHVNGTQWVNANVEPGGGIVNVSSWPKGIYIVRTDGRTIKFSKQ